MAEIEDRVVSIKFDNKNFAKNAQETMGMLDKLKEKMSFKGATDGFNALQAAQKNVNFRTLSDGISSITNKLSVMGAVGFSVIQSLTQQFMGLAQRVAGMTIDPLVGGGKQRAKNLEQAKFLFEGLGMDIEDSMDSALQAVKGTAFGLDEAAKAAAQMGGSGLRAGDEMTGALRGIAGVAAMTGSTYDEMAQIWTSAAGIGTVSNQQLAQISWRGLNAAAALAEQMGITEEAVKEMARNGELDFQTFAKGMDDAFGEHATKANETYTGSLANLRAALARIGASFYGPNLTQMRDIFNALTPVIDNVHDALKPLINTISVMGGLSSFSIAESLGSVDLTNFAKAVKTFSEGLGSAFKGVHQIFKAIKEAFREIFPPGGDSAIIFLANAFKNLFDRLLLGEGTLASIKSIFKGVFSIFAIGIDVVKKLYLSIVTLLDGVDIGSSGNNVLEWFTNLGDNLTSLKERLVDGGEIFIFFAKLVNTLRSINLDPIREQIDRFKESFSNFLERFSRGKDKASETFNDVADGIGNAKDSAKEAVTTFDYLGNAAQAFVNALGWVAQKASAAGQKIKEVFIAVKEDLSTDNFGKAGDIFNVGLLAGAAYAVKSLWDKVNNVLDFGSLESWKDKIDEVLGSVTETLGAMQAKLKSEALLNIAKAIGLLAISLVILSMIDPIKLTAALTATAAGMAELAATMAVLTKIEMGPKGAAKIQAMGTAMILLGVALIAMSLAIKILSTIDGERLATSLLAVGALLAGMVIVLDQLPNEGKMISAGIGLMAIATALLIMVIPVKILGSMDPKQLILGLLGLAALLAGITAAVKNFGDPKHMFATGLGIMAMAVALTILVIPVKILGAMDPKQLVLGLIGVALLIAGIVVAVKNIDGATMLAASLGIIGLAVGITILAVAVKMLGEMDPWQLVQGIAAVAVTLLILAVAANAIQGALAGVAGIVILAGALVILGAALTIISAIGIEGLIIAIVAIAAVLIIFAVAAIALSAAVPGMLALSVALVALGIGLALIGASVFLVGAGLYFLAMAFRTIVELIAGSPEAVSKALDLLADKMGEIMRELMSSVIDVIQMLIDALPDLLSGLGEALLVLIEELREILPELAAFIGELITEILELLREKVPLLIEVGFELIQALLQGISDNIGEITNKAVDILLTFLTAMKERMPDIVTAGADLLVAFINGIAANTENIIEAVVNLITVIIVEIANAHERITQAGIYLVTTIIGGISSMIQAVIDAGKNLIINLITGMGNAAIDIVNAATNMIVQFLLAIASNFNELIEGGKEMALQIMAGLADNTISFLDSAFTLLINFLNDLEQVIRDNSQEIRDSVMGVVDAIIDGITGGLSDRAGEVWNGIGGLAGGAKDAFMSAIGADSPSKDFKRMAGYITDGLVLGLKDTAPEEAVSSIGKSMVQAFNSAVSDIAYDLQNLDEFNPKITPVLDLTKVKSEAGYISGILATDAVSATASADQASIIASQTASPSDQKDSTPSGPTEIKFEQNNYSPEALSTGDIWRNTRSQFALAKEKLAG